ncbi:hypothetical protein PFLUV_G00028270 [Perca fluviatilis]|uniref:Uncharacterized protein n=1 Tax=Perca fluviatilis TaxID=8168 RepID=A0A6A5ET69_PERFL|nr:hypothetical protein PFLUV_G00028270 [Perca fluviatilis]
MEQCVSNGRALYGTIPCHPGSCNGSKAEKGNGQRQWSECQMTSSEKKLKVEDDDYSFKRAIKDKVWTDLSSRYTYAKVQDEAAWTCLEEKAFTLATSRKRAAAAPPPQPTPPHKKLSGRSSRMKTRLC